jgi:hypothetical protein
MAQAARPVKRRGGYLADNLVQVILIAVCVVLIAGYAWLLPQWAKRGTSLIQVQKDIKQNVEDTLSKADPSIAARSAPSAYAIAYDSSFFSKVGKYAADGIKYNQLLAKSGYDSLDDVTAELSAAGLPPGQETLKADIAMLRDKITTLDNSYSQAKTDLGLAQAARDTAKGLEADESAKLQAALDQSSKDLAAAKKAYDQDMAHYNEQLNQAIDDSKKAWAEKGAEAERFKKALADKDEQMAKLTDDLTVASHELELKRPKKVTVSEGRILQASPTEGYAIIDLGKREGIRLGEKFTVVREGRGNILIPKAELQVVRVGDLVSRTEVTQGDVNDPIMRGDLAERLAKTE